MRKPEVDFFKREEQDKEIFAKGDDRILSSEAFS